MGLFNRGGFDDVLAKGSATRATITAIYVHQTKDEDPVRLDDYTVQLSPSEGGRRFVIRQNLSPDEFVRLGMEVIVVVWKDNAVIDWTSTMARSGVGGSNEERRWKMLKDEGRVGVSDDTLGLDKASRKWTPGTVQITSVEPLSKLGGLVQTNRYTVTVTIAGEQPYETSFTMQEVPHYATHLSRAGNILPAFVNDRRLDKLKIDWPQAANANPGAGSAPAAHGPSGSGDPTMPARDDD